MMMITIILFDDTGYVCQLKMKKKKQLILHPLISTNSREGSFMPHKIRRLDVRYDFLSLTEDKDKTIRR